MFCLFTVGEESTVVDWCLLVWEGRRSLGPLPSANSGHTQEMPPPKKGRKACRPQWNGRLYWDPTHIQHEQTGVCSSFSQKFFLFCSQFTLYITSTFAKVGTFPEHIIATHLHFRNISTSTWSRLVPMMKSCLHLHCELDPFFPVLFVRQASCKCPIASWPPWLQISPLGRKSSADSGVI